MKDLRVKGSMKKIYTVRCYKTSDNGPILMQIPRCYKMIMFFGDKKCLSLTSEFKSLLRINGRWTLDRPYYCYAYDHKYRPLPRLLSCKLDIIAVLGFIRDKYRITKDKTHFGILKLWWRSKQTFKSLLNFISCKLQKKCTDDFFNLDL